LADDQESLVASNLATIAESKFESHFQLRAIYDGDSLVGMMAFCHENDPEDYELFWLFRLMIDKSHQGNGFGLSALRLAIEEIGALGATRIRTMHKPINVIASSLYDKVGFERTGEILDDGDIVRELVLRRTKRTEQAGA
jgi:diamine N-acetyltransferase